MSSLSAAPASATRLALLAWVAAFVVHRALVAAFAFDGVFFWEESYRLLVAEALRSGWNIPLHDLQADPYSGGSLVFGALAAVAISVFGPSLLVLKGVALAWSAAGLWLWLLVVDRVFGRSAAHLLGLVWLAAPPVFVVFNVVAMGFHSDTITLTALQLVLMYRYLDDPGRSGGRLAAWMAAGGFGLWFGYASAPALAVCVAYALMVGALPVRRWALALAAFAAGFSPWVVYNVTAGGSLDVLAQTFSGDDGDPRGYLTRLFDLTVRGVPAALYFRNIGIPGDVKVARDVFAYPYLAIYAVCWTVAVLATFRRLAGTTASAASSRFAPLRAAASASPELPLLAVFPFFLVLLAGSNQQFNDYGTVPWFTFRVLVPALPSLFFAVALTASRAPGAQRGAVAAACVLTALVGTGQLLFDGNAARSKHETEAWNLGAEAMGHLVVFKHGTDAAVARERVLALPAELRASAWRGVGFSYTWLFGTRRADAPVSELVDLLHGDDDRDVEHRRALFEGARLAISTGLPQVAPLPESERRDAIRDAITIAQVRNWGESLRRAAQRR